MSIVGAWCSEKLKFVLTRPVLTAGGVALICACGGEPTGPESTAGPAAAEPAAVAPEAAIVPLMSASAVLADGTLDFSAEVADLKARILPAFGREADARALSDGLSAIEQTLSGGDRLRTRLLVQATRAALRSSTAGRADLDAVRLTLDAFERALDPAKP